MSSISVREALTSRDLAAFIRFPHKLYTGDPNYSPPLNRDMRLLLSGRNPFFRHAEARYFLAEKDGTVAGRIASIVNRRHNEYHGDRAGFWGFFECIENPQISDMLLNAVAKDLSCRGMNVMRGPMNFSTNEECAFLCEGYDSPPVIMMPYNPPYYHHLMEMHGMKKARDLIAFLYRKEYGVPAQVERVASIARKKGLTVRTLNGKRFLDDMRKFMEVYNSAWDENWGFVPLTDEEIVFSASRLKPIADPELIFIAEFEGNPVGFLGMIPDYNVVLRKMMGKIDPVSIVRALFAERKIRDLRLLLFGVKREFRALGVVALLFSEANKIFVPSKYERIELSWILEENIPVIRVIETMAGKPYKRYRIYEKSLS